MKVTAIIVAAGLGTRFDPNLPKQFHFLDKKPILLHCLEKFQNCEKINEIIVVTAENQIQTCRDLITVNKTDKVTQIIQGGKTRQDSVFCGLSVIKQCDIVLIHDGVRPFITEEDINEVILATQQYNACIPGVKVKETIKQCDSFDKVINTLDRESLRIIQTPQGFKYDLILAAYKNARDKNVNATDDAALVELMGIDVKIIPGSYKNIKITTKEDLNNS